MGPQGSGKGTQARMLCEAFDLTHISVGDIFRWNVQAHTKLGARVKRIMKRGELIGDDVVEQIVHNRLQDHDWNYGFLLDGFPRNAEQAEFFLESYDLNAVILLDVPEKVVRDRVMGRRICSACGMDYHLMYHRPETEGKCDVCDGDLVMRGDDTEEALGKRLADYQEKTLPTLDLFARKELIVKVDGTQGIEEVQKQIREQLDLPLEIDEQARAAAKIEPIKGGP
jgi:adenylate kinase